MYFGPCSFAVIQVNHTASQLIHCDCLKVKSSVTVYAKTFLYIHEWSICFQNPSPPPPPPLKNWFKVDTGTDLLNDKETKAELLSLQHWKQPVQQNHEKAVAVPVGNNDGHFLPCLTIFRGPNPSLLNLWVTSLDLFFSWLCENVHLDFIY